jgi:hypothetical protein
VRFCFDLYYPGCLSIEQQPAFPPLLELIAVYEQASSRTFLLKAFVCKPCEPCTFFLSAAVLVRLLVIQLLHLVIQLETLDCVSGVSVGGKHVVILEVVIRHSPL